MENTDSLVQEMATLLCAVVVKHDVARDIYWRRLGLPTPSGEDPQHIAQIRALLARLKK